MAVLHRGVTVDEWHRMADAGLFGQDARLELLDGEVIEMSPIHSPHAGCVNRLNRLLMAAVGSRAVIAIQNPVVIDNRSEPQPDLALLEPRNDDYSRSHATPSEILLLIEVSDSTLAYDRDRKGPYYGKTGVRECWIVDLAGERINVMRSPSAAGYRDVEVIGRGRDVSVGALPDVRLEVSAVLA
jgi:Uma2 family endonuclease